MKLYRIRWRDALWHVFSGEESIATSDDRDQLVQVARKVAARNFGELYVCDKRGRLEFSFIYTEGNECVRLIRRPRLRVVGDC
jgi:hypothetical protein